MGETHGTCAVTESKTCRIFKAVGGMLAYRYALRMCAERVKPGVCLWLGGGSERVNPLNQEPALMAEAWDG